MDRFEFKKLPSEFKAKWIAALRSGEYKQGKINLYTPFQNTYCCLGVACNLLGYEKYSLNNLSVPSQLPDKSLLIPELDGYRGIFNDNYNPIIDVLARMNDGFDIPQEFKDKFYLQNRTYSFNEIADFIETHL